LHIIHSQRQQEAARGTVMLSKARSMFLSIEFCNDNTNQSKADREVTIDWMLRLNNKMDLDSN
jgi:hypothetical protein